MPPAEGAYALRTIFTHMEAILATTGILISHWNGRFGNRMHQYAYATEYARTFGVDCILPSEWEGTRLFKPQPYRIVEDDELRLLLNQSQPSYDNFEARARAINAFNARTGSTFEVMNPDNPLENWAGKRAIYIDSIAAYHRTIFERMSRDYLRKEVFVFSNEVRNTDFYKKYSDMQGTYDIAHLRRDDIANPAFNRNLVQGYSVLSIESYHKAFRKYGFDPETIQWISDDYTGKWHINREQTVRGGWSYPLGSEYLGSNVIFDWLPDFIKLYFARTIFRANSSFSWWASFLSPSAKVYSPLVNQQVVYGRDSFEEVHFEFVEGNHPHWMHGCNDILFQEDIEAQQPSKMALLRQRVAATRFNVPSLRWTHSRTPSKAGDCGCG